MAICATARQLSAESLTALLTFTPPPSSPSLAAQRLQPRLSSLCLIPLVGANIDGCQDGLEHGSRPGTGPGAVSVLARLPCTCPAPVHARFFYVLFTPSPRQV